jgi:hypothetical protein
VEKTKHKDFIVACSVRSPFVARAVAAVAAAVATVVVLVVAAVAAAVATAAAAVAAAHHFFSQGPDHAITPSSHRGQTTR